jgi:hypothetical protein
MATTDHAKLDRFESLLPHTFNAMQHLIMAMEDYYKARGKTTLFGRDKGLAAYKKFEDKLRDTLLAMVLDNFKPRNATPEEWRDAIVAMILAWSEASPNWHGAYAFAVEYFEQQRAVAIDRIRDLMAR